MKEKKDKVKKRKTEKEWRRDDDWKEGKLIGRKLIREWEGKEWLVKERTGVGTRGE